MEDMQLALAKIHQSELIAEARVARGAAPRLQKQRDRSRKWDGVSRLLDPLLSPSPRFAR